MSGLSAAAGRLTKAVSDLAKGALDAKSALGIKSPSREFAQQVGTPSALGIAAGFTQAIPKVTANLVSGVAGLMEKVASAVENGSRHSPPSQASRARAAAACRASWLASRSGDPV